MAIRSTIVKYASVFPAALAMTNPVFAGNQGSDLDISLTPGNGGMAGAGIVRPLDAAARQFGNPATLGAFEGNTSFTLGGSAVILDVKAEHDGRITGQPFSAKSDADKYLLPETAVQQRLNDRWTLGGGVHVVSGLGSDFRDANPVIRPIVELIVFGANMGAAYQVNDRLSVGVGATLAFGFLELGLTSNTALRHNFGLRGTAGFTYDLGSVAVAGTYKSELALDFTDLTETAPGVFSDFDLEQPREITIGMATTDSFSEGWHAEVNLRWKDWSSAQGYQDVWDDQFIGIVGAQYNLGRLALRGGYSYSSDLQKDTVGTSVGNFSSLNVGGQQVPLSGPLIRFIQATLTQPYWQQQATVGLGVKLTDTLRADLHVGYAFDGNRTIGGTAIEVNELQTGAGFTWRF